MIKFNPNAWLKPYIDMITDLKKKAKNDFEEYFSKLMNNTENIGIQNLSQQKKEETTWYQNQIIILQNFSQKIY